MSSSQLNQSALDNLNYIEEEIEASTVYFKPKPEKAYMIKIDHLYLENTMKMIRENANRANKDANNFQVILLTFPNIVDTNSRTTLEDGQRSPLTGTIDEIGHDVKKIKEIGISHIIFGFNFSPIGADIDGIIAITKQLSKFAK